MAHLERWLWRGGVYGLGALFLLLVVLQSFSRDYGWYILLVLPLMGAALLVAAAAVVAPLVGRRPVWWRTVAGSLALVALMWLPWGRVDRWLRVQAFQDRYERVVEKVHSGELAPGPNGRLALQGFDRLLAQNGQAYVWGKGSEQEVHFQVGLGWFFERWEYVYSTKSPQLLADFMEVEWQRGPWYYVHMSD